MEAKKSSSKQVVAILLLVIGLAAGVFGVLGLVGGGGMDPYEARNGRCNDSASYGPGFPMGKHC